MRSIVNLKISNNESNNEKKTFLITLVLLVIHFTIAYPGSFSYDTLDQYKQALEANFLDHNPASMAFLWSVFMLFTKNPATMLFFHLLLLWLAVYNFATSLATNNRISYSFFLIPFLPFILNNSLIIWKDVGFSYSFILAIAIMTKHLILKQRLNYFTIIIITSLLIYGSGIKYIAVYLLPTICLAFAYLLLTQNNTSNSNSLINSKIIWVALIIFTVIFAIKNTVNNGIINKKGKTNFWQLVKLYDLAGIAVQTDDYTIFPPYIINHLEFSKEQIVDKYNSKQVDELVFGPIRNVTIPILISTNNNDDLTILKENWLKAVLKYPKAYFMHRFLLWKNTLKVRYTAYILPEQTNNPPEYQVSSSKLRKLINKYVYISNSVFELPKYVILLIPIYFFFSLHNFRKNKVLLPVIILNSTAILQIVFLFNFSMASDGRYLYFSLLAISFSHPYIYLCLKNYIK